ncbi:tRNA 2-thiouridine(34) synthase MnmA [Spirochaetota bacterium]
MNSKVKVAVGLSGGVDSSVSALLLKEAGYDVIGLTMKIFDESFEVSENSKHACYGPGEDEDIEMAEKMCGILDIPFHVLDLCREYEHHVLDYFRNEYVSGRTPNPCVVCNNKLKFGFLIDKARDTGINFDYFATGHYARIEKVENRYLLKKAVDASKDQTYFIYTLTSNLLSKIMFPLGSMTKDRVREKAKELDIEIAFRPESQDFIAGGDYSPLFKDVKVQPGDIIDEEGNVLGRHNGIMYYTVGQRRGLGIGGREKPLYVLKIDVENNRVVVTDREGLFSEGLIANDIRLSAIDILDKPYKINARIRQNSKEAPATLYPFDDNRAKVVFDDPQYSITPGQSVVFYDGEIVFGGGIIEEPIV